MGLSIRRANTVAAELVKDGVPKAAIAIEGFGETHLLCRPVRTCVSRRTGGSKSSSSEAAERSGRRRLQGIIGHRVMAGCLTVGGNARAP